MKAVPQTVTTAIGSTVIVAGQSDDPKTGSTPASAPVLVEFGPETLRLLAEIGIDIKRLADHFAPEPADIIGTPFLANRLGCTTTWITQMVRSGEIPKGCIVSGSGRGRQWKFYRRRIEKWLSSR